MSRPCNKKKHRNKAGAAIAKRKMKNAVLNVYFCDECKAWHLGTSKNPMRRLDRINQVINLALKRDASLVSHGAVNGVPRPKDECGSEPRQTPN